MPVVEQEFDTPGDALAHYGKKGMRWGITTAVKDTTSSASASVNNAANRSVAATKSAASRSVQGTKNVTNKSIQGTKNATNKSVQGTKNAVNKTVQGTKDAASRKTKAVANNSTVKEIEFQGKGAVWGTREAYIQKTLKDADRAQSIGAGKAGIDSRVFAAKDGILFKKQAKIAAPIFEHHAERVKAGKMKTRDILLMTARVRRRDLTIGMDMAGKKDDAAKKRGKRANYDMPKQSVKGK